MISASRIIGNYQLEHELGRGGTSHVWKARHRVLTERIAAVKILLSQEEETVTRFTREADLTSRLRHPNIIGVYDHGQSGSFFYTVMELAVGGSLRQYLEKVDKLSVKDSVSIFRQIASALDFAHAQGIIHRDVAPGNILLESGPDGRVLLTDFGIARLPQQSHTTAHVIMGTPGFFSPEHAKSATAVTALSDLYGLGVILYVMLTGTPPWDKLPEHPTYHFGPIIPLRDRGVDLAPDVDRVLQTLLAVEPSKRYPSAAAAVDALDRALVRSGIVLNSQQSTPDAETAIRAINTVPNYRAVCVIESEVEHVLGADLIREPIERAHKRADSLRDPIAIARLLDAWSDGGSFWEFRREYLGRIANLREVSSRNVYFYQLDVLLETRSQPTTVEEPDKDRQHFPVQREQERWQIKLPRPTKFVNDPGREQVLTGSERIIPCDRCDSQGVEICPQCKGQRRIKQERAVQAGQQIGQGNINQQETVVQHRAPDGGVAVVEQPSMVAAPYEVKQAVIPCPNCNGTGSLKCEHCQGATMMVQRKVFHWSRTALQRRCNDDVPNLDENALRGEAELTLVYNETSVGVKREWRAVPALKELITAIEQQTNTDTKIVLAKASIHMIPFTVVQLDLGRQEIALEDDQAPRSASDDQVHTVYIKGFENNLEVGSFAMDSGRRLMVFAFIFFAIMFVIYTVYVFIFV